MLIDPGRKRGETGARIAPPVESKSSRRLAVLSSCRLTHDLRLRIHPPPGMDDDRTSPEQPGQGDDEPAHDRDQPDELEHDDAEHGLQIGTAEIWRDVTKIVKEEAEPRARRHVPKDP